MGSVAVFLY